MTRYSFLLALPLTACSTVPPGHVVLADRVIASDPTQRFSVIHGGRYWAGINTNYYELPAMEQRSVWTQSETEGSPNDESITFAGRDGQAVNCDVAIGFSLSPDDASIIQMVQTFGADLNLTIDGRVRDSVRSALNMCASTFTVEQIYGEQKGPLFDCALKKVQEEYGPKGLNVVRLTLNSEIRLPERVKTAMEAANAATQQAIQVRNEVEKTRAEGEKRIAEAQAAAEAVRLKAEAEAKANNLLSQSLTPAVLESRRLEVQQQIAEKWNGQLPNTMLGEGVPLLSLPAAER